MMPGEMGELTGTARGTVVKGEWIERVLAMLPDAVWDYDDEYLMGDDQHGYVPFPISTTIPMATRRAIIGSMIGVMMRRPVWLDA